jgi:hypothetical protein
LKKKDRLKVKVIDKQALVVLEPCGAENWQKKKKNKK